MMMSTTYMMKSKDEKSESEWRVGVTDMVASGKPWTPAKSAT